MIDKPVNGRQFTMNLICLCSDFGSAPKQLTNFKDSLMTGFAWSKDGKQLATTRGSLMRDAVLITDMR